MPQGLIPVIVQMDANLIDVIDSNKDQDFGTEMDGAQILQERQKEVRTLFETDNDFEAFTGTESEASGEEMKLMDTASPERVNFALVRLPIQKAEDVFVHIPVGGWNDMPTPQQHRAVAKYWNEKHGAEPCFISMDEILYYLPKPIETDKAFELAQEHVAYSIDTVEQGNMTIWDHSDSLKKSCCWYFWWD